MDIIVENVSKLYGYQKAVDNVSFTVKTGEVLGFLGPNGAGKTTTMKAITCYLAPSSGNISVGGISVHEDPISIKKNIGYMPETNPLYDEMPVIEYLQFVAGLYGIPKNIIRQRIVEMVNVCGLEGEKHKLIGELSKGYQQRVGLAQALIHDPQVLILDEPTSGLDPNQIVEIRKLIKTIGKEKTVILSSHILGEVEATCDRILIINKGRIVANGTAEELRRHSQGRDILKVGIEDGESATIMKEMGKLSSILQIDRIADMPNHFEVQTTRNDKVKREIFDMCRKNHWYISELTSIETKLEDIFRELTISKN